MNQSPQHAAATEQFAGICEAEQELTVTDDSSFLSWHSFISPTADWFVSVNDFEFCQSNQWITTARVPLFPYSEGTLQVPDCTLQAQDAVQQDLSAQMLHGNSSMWVDDSMLSLIHI